MSPIVPAAAWAVAVYALVPPFPALVAAVFAASAGISLSAISRTRRTGLSLLLLAVCTLAALNCRVADAVGEQAGPGIDPSRVTMLHGVTLGISERVEDRNVLSVRVVRVEDEFISADSRFTARVYAGAGLPPGSEVAVEVAGLKPSLYGGWTAEALVMETVGSAFGGALRERVYRAAERAISRSAGDAGVLLDALLLGSRSGLSVRTEELFRRAGISHVLALSGMHLALIAALVVAMVKPLAGSRVALVAGGVVALLYMLLIGPRPSLVRATIMCEMVIWSKLRGRPLHLLEIIAGAFLLHTLLQPAALSEVSFQLSYLALVGIAALAPALMREVRPWVPGVVSGPVVAGVGAQVAGAPVILGTFGRIYPVGIVAGAVVAPLVSLLMVGGILAALLGAIPIPALSGFTARILTVLATVIERVAWWFSAAPGLRGGPLPAVMVAVGATGLGFLAEQRRIRWTGQK